MRKEEEIRLLCNFLMFACTVQHAAVSFTQYDEYAFPPNYPIYLDSEPPVDKVRVQFQIVSIVSSYTSIRL